jgi:hypothetical protein
MNFVEINMKFTQNNPLNEKKGCSFLFSKQENPTYSLFQTPTFWQLKWKDK